MTAQPRSLNVIVAALGGEGGGVLSDWLIAAAAMEGLLVQSTSIPGVAQRTGATTYYLEIFPHRLADADRRPILALTPTPADIDVVAASELVEAGRALQNGYVTPQRTTLIASTNRVFAIGEKSAMADGRFASDRILKAAETLAQRAILFDMAATAQSVGAPINAVLFGALIGSGALPISRASAEQAIRQTKKSIESNLRGFAAGFDASQRTSADGPSSTPSHKRARTNANELVASAHASLPPAVHGVVELGIGRLVDYQGAAYADLFVRRLAPVARLEARVGATDFAVTRETARFLALWMSYEDVIRVAELKTRPDRFDRVRDEVSARDGDVVQVTDFLKPGIDEACSILPPRLGRALLAWARAHSLEERLNVGMYVRSTGVLGFLLLRLLAGLKWWRPYSLRYQDEQHLIERWLDAVTRAAAIDLALAREIAECAQLVKGYGDTHRRGVENFTLIEQTHFSADCAPSDAPMLADAIRRARQAALADPEGGALHAVIAPSMIPVSPTSPSREAATG